MCNKIKMHCFNWYFYHDAFNYYLCDENPVTTQAHTVPRISVSVPSTEHTATQTVHHHPHPHPLTHPHHPHQHSNQANQHHNHTSLQSHPIQTHQIPTPQVIGHQTQHHPNHVPASHQNHPSHVLNQRLGAPQPLPQVSVQQQQHQQLQHHQQQQFHSLTKKAHLIETQLNLDQNGAIKPDIHTPFRDKKDACIRLIRYHCLDQPVLSEKDLDKADEIFELTARHFIGKYAKMVDKYKYLLMKESMRHVQTSELMMLDRMFLAEEQQSLMKLRQDYENELLNLPLAVPDAQPPNPAMNEAGGQPLGSEPHPEDYDEWACIQRELGYLPQSERSPSPSKTPGNAQQPQSHPANSSAHHSKRSASSDSRLETLKRFRVDKHNKKPSDVHISSGSSVQSVITSVQSTFYTQAKGAQSQQSCSYENLQNSSYSSHEDNEPENNSIDEQVQSAIDSILNLQQNTALDLDSILS